MIAELTQAQQEACAHYVEKWTKIGLSTERGDRATAENAARTLYAQAGLPIPEFVWHQSFGAVNYLIAPLREVSEVQSMISDPIPDRVIQSLSVLIDHDLYMALDKIIDGQVSDNIKRAVYLRAEGRRETRKAVWLQAYQDVQRIPQFVAFASFDDPVFTDVEKDIHWGVRNLISHSTSAGQFAAFMFGSRDYIRNELGFVRQTDPCVPLMNIAQSCGGVLFNKSVCQFVERPIRISVDEDGYCHHDTQKAIEYADGWGVYAWHGCFVTDDEQKEDAHG